MDSKFTKKQMATIRRLAGLAYEREMSEALSELANQFDQWRAGAIDSYELQDLIHQYHDGLARQSWSRYHSLKPLLSVPMAIALGHLKPDDLPPDVRDTLVEHADSLKDLINQEDPPNDEA